MKNYLVERGVHLEFGMEVVDIDFYLSADAKTATVLHLKNGNEIVLGENGYVFITNGSLTESTDKRIVG
jgi:oleate hydratase